MYRKHFGLTQHPFSNEIEPEELFLATSYKELEVRLAHLIDMRGIGLVTGDSGSGKTCCCRKVLHALHASLYRVGADKETVINYLLELFDDTAGAMFMGEWRPAPDETEVPFQKNRHPVLIQRHRLIGRYALLSTR